jgi:hypothetical protein
MIMYIHNVQNKKYFFKIYPNRMPVTIFQYLGVRLPNKGWKLSFLFYLVIFHILKLFFWQNFNSD